MTTDKLYTIKETAEILSTRTRYVYTLINTGWFNPVNVGINKKMTRIRQSEIEKFLNREVGHEPNKETVTE